MAAGRIIPWGGVKPGLGAEIDRSLSLSSQLGGCYLLNEGGGADLHNLVTGETAAGVVPDVTMWQAGRDGPCLKCQPAGGDFVILGRPAGMDLTSGDFCIEAWVRQDTNPGAAGIFGYYDTAGTSHYARMFYASGRVAFGIGNGATLPVTLDTVATVDGKWHHVVGVRTGGQILLYRDGVLRDTAAESIGNLSAANMAWYIGRNALTGGATLSGAVDLCRMWQRGLSAGEVIDLYKASYRTIRPITRRRFASLPSGPTSVSASEGGAGTDAASLSASGGVSETGAGTESTSAQATLTTAETGAGTEAAALAAFTSATETGAGSDAASISAVLAATETGAGSEAQALAAVVTAAESGAGTDAASVDQGGANKSASEGAPGSEGASIQSGLSTGETGAGTDAASLLATGAAAESGAGSETALLAVQLSASETAPGIEASALSAALSVGETGAGTEALLLTVTLSAAQTGAGSDGAAVAVPGAGVRFRRGPGGVAGRRGSLLRGSQGL